MSRVEGIKWVSRSLRRMAIKEGKNIDDTYRNENGVAFQLASMESAYYGSTTIKPATKLFAQVVDLYHNDRHEFEKILTGVLDMVESKDVNFKESFMKWLATQVTPAQFSVLGDTYPEIERFCLRARAINTPLFSSVDYERAKKIKSTIEANKVFRFSHKKQMARFVAAATQFMHYCKSIREAPSEPKNKIREDSAEKEGETQPSDEYLAKKYPIIFRKVKDIVCEAGEKISASVIKEQIGAIARLSDIEYILENASWGYQVNEIKETTSTPATESTESGTSQYFSILKTKHDVAAEKVGEVIKDWGDVRLVSEKLIARNKFRDNLFFVVLVNTGLTVDTALKLKFSDFINQDRSYKKVLTINSVKTAANCRAEGGDYQLNKDVLSSLFLYIQSKRSFELNDYLFTGEGNRSSDFAPITRQTATRILAEITQEIDNKYSISARMLKNTYDYHFAVVEREPISDDVKSEPIKRLSDIIRIKSFLVSNRRYRDNLLFAVGLGFGLTARELKQLRFSHILNENGSVKSVFPVLGGDFDDVTSEYYVEVSNEVKHAIELYRKYAGITDYNEYVFQSESNRRTGNALASNSILRIIKDVIEVVGVDVNAATLTFRKTFAYHQLLMSGGNVKMKTVVRKALNYDNVNQMLEYLRSNEEEFEGGVELDSSEQVHVNDTVKIRTIDFNIPDDYSYYMPQFFTYFGDKCQDLSSWTDLYVKLFTWLQDDYPHVLRSGMSFTESDGTRIDLTTEDQQSMLSVPQGIAHTNLVLETDISVSNMIDNIRFWLEQCNVDFENVEIVCSKRETAEQTKRIEERPKGMTDSEQILHADEKYKTVLCDRFIKGYRLASGLDLKKFKRYYLEIHGVELLDDDDTIVSKIRNCGIVHEDKLFVPEMMLSPEIKDKLFSYIADEFAQRKKALYYEALFRVFSEYFLDYYIYNAEMLKTYLAYYNEGRYHITANYIAMESGVAVKPYDEVKDFLIGAGVPVDSEAICEVLSHIPRKKVMQILGMNAEFINNGKSCYFHVSVISLSQEELENIAALISDLIQEKEFISGNELVDAIKIKYPYIIDNNQSFSTMGMRDAIKYNLQNRFSFSGNVISGKGKWMSMADVFANYARSRSAFDIAELETLAEEMNSTIYFEAVYDNALRISQSRFVSKDQAQFRTYETDLAIERFCVGKYISVASITEFGSFPDAGFQWNSYLLANYVHAYSKRYRLLTAGFNKSASVGAIVSRDSGIETFDDFLVIALAEGDCKLKKEDALNFLVDHGYLARRNYSSIEKILIQANAQRNMRGND